MTCIRLEHSHPIIPPYSILSSQKTTLSIMQYHFTIHSTSEFYFTILHIKIIYLYNKIIYSKEREKMRQQRDEADFCRYNKIIIFGFKILLQYHRKFAIAVLQIFLALAYQLLTFFCAEMINLGKIWHIPYQLSYGPI